MERVNWRVVEAALRRQGLGPGQGLRLWSLKIFAGAALCCFFGRGTGRERFTGSGPWRSVLSSAALYTRRPPRPPQEPPPVSTGRNPPTQANGCLQGHGSGKLELVERVGEEMEGMRLPPLCDRAASTPPRLMLWRRGLVREKATRGHAMVPPCGH